MIFHAAAALGEASKTLWRHFNFGFIVRTPAKAKEPIEERAAIVSAIDPEIVANARDD